MRIQRISFYDQFNCTQAQCPDTCCSGWRIPIDPQTLSLYHKQKGAYRLKLELAISRKDNIPALNRTLIHCPFHDKDGLCSLQKEHGEEHMPLICRRYPRNHKNYGAFAVETLDLSCPEAARIFLENQKSFFFENVEANVNYPRTGTNQDYEFLRFLLDSRQQIIHLIEQMDSPFESIFPQLIQYGRTVQNQMIAIGLEKPYKDCCFSDYADSSNLLKPRPTTPTDASTVDITPDNTVTQLVYKPLCFTGSLMDAMITSGLYHTRLKHTVPLLYELCTLYFQTFDSLSGEEATRQITVLWHDLIREIPTLQQTMKRYYIYYLDCCYFEIFESYSFLKTLTKGFIHMEILQLFFSLYYKEHHSLTQLEQARIIAAYEKRARHNTDITDAMYSIIYPELP